MEIATDPPGKRGKLTLAIDVGGTRLKAGLLDQKGEMVAGPNRVDTPPHPTPQIVVDALIGLAAPFGHFDRISVGFPGPLGGGRHPWRQGCIRSNQTDERGHPPAADMAGVQLRHKSIR